MPTLITFEEADPKLDWLDLTEALVRGHDQPKAEIADVFLYRDENTLLNRSAWISGMGVAVKCATVFPHNPKAGKPMIDGAVSLFSDDDGALEAILDFKLVTKWKTAADSLLAARRLARPDSEVILIVGAGTVGASLYDAYSAAFPSARFLVWNRSVDKAHSFCGSREKADVATDLKQAIANADIVTSATMTSEPLIKGDWLRPGQHIDLIGAYRPDMREVDDKALQRSRIFVDSFDTTIGHIGEMKIPLASGAIRRADVLADYYDLGRFQRSSEEEITLFKNGGGAHLDLMTSRYIHATTTRDTP